MVIAFLACIPATAMQLSAQSETGDALELRIAKETAEYRKWKNDRSNRLEYMHRLRDNAQSPDKHFGGQAETAQEELARLGDREQMNSIVCELYARDPYVQLDAIRKLDRVGGYASIEALSALIIGNFLSEHSRNTLRASAVRVLSGLIPELKVPLILRLGAGTPQEEQVREWYDWIGAHRNQLGRLQPSEGGDLTQSDCARLQNREFKLDDVLSIQITMFSSTPNSSHQYTILNRAGRFFMGAKPVDSDALTALVTAVTAPLEENSRLSDFGIGTAWLAANAGKALAEIPSNPVDHGSGIRHLTPEEKRRFLELFSDPEKMNGLLQGNFYFYRDPGNCECPGANVEISLRSGGMVKLWAQGSKLFLLPWTIQGQELRKLFDFRLSRAVASLLPADAPYANCLSGRGPFSLRLQLALELARLITSKCFEKGNDECSM